MNSALEKLKKREEELLALNSKLDQEKNYLYEQYEVNNCLIEENLEVDDEDNYSEEQYSEKDKDKDENDEDNSEENDENSFMKESLPRDYLLQEINRLKPLNEAKKMAELEKIKHENELIEVSLQEKQRHDQTLTQELEKLRISLGIKEEDIILCQKSGKSISEKTKNFQNEINGLQTKLKVQREKLEALERKESALQNENTELIAVLLFKSGSRIKIRVHFRFRTCSRPKE